MNTSYRFEGLDEKFKRMLSMEAGPDEQARYLSDQYGGDALQIAETCRDIFADIGVTDAEEYWQEVCLCMVLENASALRAPMSKDELKWIDECVGQRLKNARILRDMSQSDVAAAIGLTFQQVQKYERGMNRLSASRMVQISKILNFRPAYFFEDLPDYEGEDSLSLKDEHLKLIRYYEAAPESMREEFLKLLKAAGGKEEE